ncbi:MAG: Cof-type HAD-IIB family hydrolase [Clostridia bacterium]|nr:Cof-type HAD-IIB family hydrolase [Clostridia bacterium]
MKKFDGILICSDLDGTLLQKNEYVSPENREAIAYFKSEGGTFTFITGRMPRFVGNCIDAVRPNAPIGCINGGGIYDYPNKKYLWTHEASRDILDLVELAEREMPSLGIQLNTFENTYFCRDNSVMVWFRELTGAEYLTCNCRETEEPIAKILFGVETEEEMERLDRLLKAHPTAKNFDFVSAEKTLYEILPKGVNKGNLLAPMVNLLGMELEKTIAVGDYDNDVQMLRAAKLGIAVANASPAAKAAADHVTVSNEEHAIARIISDLDSGALQI